MTDEIGYTSSEFFEMIETVRRTPTTQAKEHYAAHLANIGERLTRLLDWNLRSQETTDDAPRDWRDVGDAAHIDDLLAMACEFLEMETETPHPNRAGVKYAVYLSPKQGEAAMILGEGDFNAGVRKALDRACLDRMGNFFCTLPLGHKGDHSDRSVGPPTSMTWTNRVNP